LICIANPPDHRITDTSRGELFFSIEEESYKENDKYLYDKK